MCKKVWITINLRRPHYTVLTHNMHIFVRPKKVFLFWETCLFWENALILGIGGFCIKGMVYTVKILVLELNNLFIILENFFPDIRNVSSISSGFYVVFLLERVCLFRKMCLFWVCLLWLERVFKKFYFLRESLLKNKCWNKKILEIFN